MFTPLHSSTNQGLFEKHVCNHSNHYEKYDDAVRPSYRLKLKYPLPFSVSYSMFDLLHSSTNQEVFEKHLCYKSSIHNILSMKVATTKNTDDFSLCKGSHHVQPPN